MRVFVLCCVLALCFALLNRVVTCCVALCDVLLLCWVVSSCDELSCVLTCWSCVGVGLRCAVLC